MSVEHFTSVYTELPPHILDKLVIKANFQRIADKIPDDFEGCIIWRDPKKLGLGGYPYVRIQELKNSYKRGVHQVLALKKAGRLGLNEGEEVSHLCDQKLCINEKHVCIETHTLNTSRDDCHKPRPNFHQNCPHYPACIRNQ